MKTTSFQVKTGGKPAIVDITDRVEDFVSGEGDGLVSVSLPHATAGLALMELGSGSEDDLWDRLEFMLPRDHHYRHSHGSAGHGAAHRSNLAKLGRPGSFGAPLRIRLSLDARGFERAGRTTMVCTGSAVTVGAPIEVGFG